MKSTLRVKLLQHFLNKKKDGGFTLIELLVVIIIIGILAAIALPSFLNQANKAKQSEAKTYVGSMNRAQQAYYLENDSMADEANFGGLGLGIASNTANYQYRIVRTSGSQVTNQARPSQGATASIKAYIGGVNVGVVAATNEATTLAVLCEGLNAPVVGGPTAPATDVAAYANAGPTCPGTYKQVK
jgi:type IV pilus assembly protein PilA